MLSNFERLLFIVLFIFVTKAILLYRLEDSKNIIVVSITRTYQDIVF